MRLRRSGRRKSLRAGAKDRSSGFAVLVSGSLPSRHSVRRPRSGTNWKNI